jgi:hypothetical protein
MTQFYGEFIKRICQKRQNNPIRNISFRIFQNCKAKQSKPILLSFITHNIIISANIGDIAGGLKYISNSIFFKFALDSSGLFEDNEYSMKITVYKLKGLIFSHDDADRLLWISSN